jgi:transcriptional regulator with XRE-family HTH domain
MTRLFGQRLKDLINKKGLTYAVVSERSGVSENYISQIVTGVKKPKLDTIRKLADALDEGIDYLLNDASRGIPVIAYISAGEGVSTTASSQFEIGDGLEFIDLPPGYTQEQADAQGIYALKVRGSSMEPRLFDGNYLYIKPSNDKNFKNGDRVIFRDSEGTGWVKEIETINCDTIIFKSLAPGGPTIIKKRAEIDVIERVFLIKP